MDACTSSIRDPELVGRLDAARATIYAVEAEYGRRGPLSQLYLIAPTENVDGRVTTAEMGRVYKSTFAKAALPRQIYDRIKKASPNDVCPLCGQRTVGTLDHYLPWTAYPALAVTPINLVPACMECNKSKLAYVAETEEDQLLHPYFDQIDADQWLFAKVCQTSPASLVFEARPPANWAPAIQVRLATHFRIYGLSSLYASHAGVELANIRYGLNEIDSMAGIRAHLGAQATSRQNAYRNSWATAVYQAWRDSDWFCAGGFRA